MLFGIVAGSDIIRALDGQTSSEKPTAVAEPAAQVSITLRMLNGFGGLVQEAQKDMPTGGGELFGTPADIQRMAKVAGPGSELGLSVVLLQMGNREAAVQLVSALDQQIKDGTVNASPEFLELRHDVQQGLHAAEQPAAGSLSAPLVEQLEESLGTAGKTLAAVANDDQETLRQLSSDGFVSLLALGVAGAGGIALALGGLIVLIYFIVHAATGRLMGPGPSAGVDAPIYAEMFAVWMVAFVLLARVPRLITHADWNPGMNVELVIGIAGMTAALVIALGYGRLRGIRWRTMREGIALTPPRLADLGWGLLGYAMSLALLMVGLVITMMLMALIPDGKPPSHPLQEWVQGASPLGIALTFMVASVCAPITEEIMFRGVLYRNIRDGLGRLGPLVPVIIATALSSFIFAAIHPQGLVFVPVLGALAVGFCLMREWRGSINPGIWIHAINNAVMVSLNLLLMR
jgi:membrane protease YdiL (CAAX protease family)